MRIDTTQKVRHVAGEDIVIRQSGNVSDMTSVVALNSTALDLYNALKDGDFTTDDVVRRLTDAFEVDDATARRDAEEWVAQMRAQGLIKD